MIFNRNGILHIPLSEYAFATKENELIVRLRTGKNSVKEVVLAYGDTACRKENIEFFFIKMIKKGDDHNFDYYEARIINSFPRVVYYFELIDYKDEIIRCHLISVIVVEISFGVFKSHVLVFQNEGLRIVRTCCCQPACN